MPEELAGVVIMRPMSLSRLLLAALFFLPAAAHAQQQKVIVLGFDGVDARLTEQWMAEGKLPNLARLRDQATWLLVGGALLAVAFADLSGLSKGEVERIWLPFAVWIVVAASAHRPPARTWLALQVGLAVAVQVLTRTGW